MYLWFCNNSRSISSIYDKYASSLTSNIIVQLHKGQSGYKWHILHRMWWEASFVKVPWGIFLNTGKSPLGRKSFPTIFSLKRGETDWFWLSPCGWKPPNLLNNSFNRSGSVQKRGSSWFWVKLWILPHAWPEFLWNEGLCTFKEIKSLTENKPIPTWV